MSTRSGKRTYKSKGSGRSDKYAWSDWVWDGAGYQYYRTRLNSRGEYEYQYQKQPAEEADSTPRGATISANAPILTNSSAPHSTEYYGNQEYGYQDSTQTSNRVDDLSGEFAQASLDEGQVGSTSAAPYGEHQREEQPGGVASNEYVTTQPIPIPSNPSRSAPDTSAHGYSPSSSSPSSYSVLFGRQRGFSSGMTPTISSGYMAPNPSPYYQSAQATHGASYGSYYGQVGPSMLDAYSTPIPSAGYSESSRGYADSQSGVQQTYDSSAATNSRAFTPKDSYMTISGTKGKAERLDPKFKVHRSKYFEPGQVFKVLWFEPQGENAAQTNPTEVTTFSLDVSDRKHGQRAHSSIRRFVIIAADRGHCQCLPILTYHRQATTKSGVKRDDHAIIYTGDNPPGEIEGEEPLCLRPIQVIPRTPRDKLEKESRINYAKIYTVEHNVKVHFVGRVAPSSLHKLVADFDATWMKKRLIDPFPPEFSASNTVDSSQYMGGGYQ